MNSSDKQLMEKVFAQSAYGSEWRRIGGFVTDRVLLSFAQLGGALFGGVVAALMTQRSAGPKAMDQAVAAGITLGYFFWGVVAWGLNYGVLQGMTGRSVGKMIFGLRILRADGSPIGFTRSVARSLCYVASALPLGLGFFAMLWTGKRQCWHDSICATIVVHQDAQPMEQVNRSQLELFPVRREEEEQRRAA